MTMSARERSIASSKALTSSSLDADSLTSSTSSTDCERCIKRPENVKVVT
jgi:hypothetical protein